VIAELIWTSAASPSLSLAPTTLIRNITSLTILGSKKRPFIKIPLPKWEGTEKVQCLLKAVESSI
jgi:hypothetical protein